MSCELQGSIRLGLEVDYAHEICCHGNVPLGIEKTSGRSTNLENFVKIGPVNVEIGPNWSDRNHKKNK